MNDILQQIKEKAEAQYILSVMYFKGIWVPKNDKMALTFRLGTANQGHKKAEGEQLEIIESIDNRAMEFKKLVNGKSKLAKAWKQIFKG